MRSLLKLDPNLFLNKSLILRVNVSLKPDILLKSNHLNQILKSIFRWEIDGLHTSRSKLREENRSFKDQLELKENNEIFSPLLPMNDSSQIISAGDAEMVSLSTTAPIFTSFLLLPIIIYSI